MMMMMMMKMVMIMIATLSEHFTHIRSSLPDNHPEKCYLSPFAVWKLRHREAAVLAQGREEFDIGVSPAQTTRA